MCASLSASGQEGALTPRFAVFFKLRNRRDVVSHAGTRPDAALSGRCNAPVAFARCHRHGCDAIAIHLVRGIRSRISKKRTGRFDDWLAARGRLFWLRLFSIARLRASRRAAGCIGPTTRMTACSSCACWARRRRGEAPSRNVAWRPPRIVPGDDESWHREWKALADANKERVTLPAE